MDNEAHKIARHHLGDTLTSLMRGGPTAGDWIVFACHDQTEVSARAATVAEAAADCAAQLRAAGWVPTHPRLEWERDGDAIRLVLHIDGWQHPVLSGQFFNNGDGWIGNEQQDIAGYPATVAHIFRQTQRWHAANLPSLHLPLPPFPGASQ
jgi:hypothetical protein